MERHSLKPKTNWNFKVLFGLIINTKARIRASLKTPGKLGKLFFLKKLRETQSDSWKFLKNHGNLKKNLEILLLGISKIAA